MLFQTTTTAAKGEAAGLLRKVLKNSAAVDRWTKCRVLVIDEISMLNFEVFEALDLIARTVRPGREGEPFGGLQVIVVGDFMQLPPVVMNRKELKFCFQSPAWAAAGFDAPGGRQFLSQVERQKDKDFVDFLNEIRVGKSSPKLLSLLNDCLITTKAPPDDGIVPTKLYAINKEVDSENSARLAELPGASHTLVAEDKWRTKPSKKAMEPLFRAALDSMIAEEIELKVGAQVMLLRNRSKGQYGGSVLGPSLVNGSRGKILALVESVLKPGKNNPYVVVRTVLLFSPCLLSFRVSLFRSFARHTGLILPSVRFDNGVTATIGPVEYIYKGPGGDGEIVRFQVPLKLAW